MTNQTPEEMAAAEIAAAKAVEAEAKAAAKAAKAAKEEKHPDFVDMINLKGVEVEVHKDRVQELKDKGFKLVK